MTCRMSVWILLNFIKQLLAYYILSFFSSIFSASSRVCQRDFIQIIETYEFCGGHPGSLMNVCHGDSGGPIMTQKSDRTYQLSGVVAWGKKYCPSNARYAVYTSVPYFRSWIQSNIGEQQIHYFLNQQEVKVLTFIKGYPNFSWVWFLTFSSYHLYCSDKIIVVLRSKIFFFLL